MGHKHGQMICSDETIYVVKMRSVNL